jgi:hypothetical protein
MAAFADLRSQRALADLLTVRRGAKDNRDGIREQPLIQE